MEAAYIGAEIKRLIAHTGGQLNYDDFAVLLRYNSLSRTIEGAFQTAGVPNRVLGGSKFFERAEVISSGSLVSNWLTHNPLTGQRHTSLFATCRIAWLFVRI